MRPTKVDQIDSDERRTNVSTAPIPLLTKPDSRGVVSLVAQLLHLLRYVKYAAAGAIGAIAILHTIGIIAGFDFGVWVELVTSFVGCIFMILAGKVTKIL